MPKGPAKRPKVKRNDLSDSESSDEDEPRHFFVPGERINSEVLSFFLFNYVDKRPKIRPCPHPTVRKSRRVDISVMLTLPRIEHGAASTSLPEMY